MSLQTHRLQTLDQVRAFVSSAGEASFRHADRGSAYGFCRRTLGHFRYSSLGRRDKGTVRAYLAKVTGLSRAQVQRLIRQYLETGASSSACRTSRSWTTADAASRTDRGSPFFGRVTAGFSVLQAIYARAEESEFLSRRVRIIRARMLGDAG